MTSILKMLGTGKIVIIKCYLSNSCVSEAALKSNIRLALEAEGFEAEVEFGRIDDPEATDLGLSGSPAVVIDGRELQPQETTGFP